MVQFPVFRLAPVTDRPPQQAGMGKSSVLLMDPQRDFLNREVGRMPVGGAGAEAAREHVMGTEQRE